ncbi:hypothetical protein [Fructilactobacillus cliffordii]|uniref:Uncharacterized protein n=1 Tax=Fructilactobacillus cliffordii TaxID=2940299 RepID=A0A9Q9E0W1_9LACO|nr:hypothetical protein [Fructilactobacillus cliffordii]USS86557.1 hypothetical protein M3M38_00310 [Fructilactobacillus cliffordii]USS89556.1 hypothetical protein M3M40_01850 [Fructilactobacillus cliffordii]
MEDEAVTPGTPEFDKMMFKLKQPINAVNQTQFQFNDQQLTEIQPGIYVLPVYVQDDFNLFLVGGRLVQSDWVLAFSHGTIEAGNQVTDLSEPIPTGDGLNQLGVQSPTSANDLLEYFDQLVQAGVGEWNLIK